MDVVVKPRKVTISHKVDAQNGTGPLTTTKAVTVSDDNLAINGNEDKESPSFDSSGNNYTPINHLLALSKHSQNYNPPTNPPHSPHLLGLSVFFVAAVDDCQLLLLPGPPPPDAPLT